MRNSDFSKASFKDLSILNGREFISRAHGIYIEVSGVCNAKCPYCARERFEERYSGTHMGSDLFERVLAHLIDIGIIQRAYIPFVSLYNWGEPFLNPGINDILGILKRRGLYAGVSSNFIQKLKVDENNLPVLGDVTFSLSGFSQETYGRIHGASLSKILGNFEEFYDRFRVCAPRRTITVAWHRYRFNEHELWKAFEYFDRPGICFRPSVAFMTDLLETRRFEEEDFPQERKKEAERDLFLDHLSEVRARHREASLRRGCPMWNQISIDEFGNLLLCCAMTHYDKEHVFGNVLEMSSEDIFRAKLSDSFCGSCLASGFPRAVDLYGNKSLPQGRVSNRFKLWYRTRIPKTPMGLRYHLFSRVAKIIPNRALASVAARLAENINRIGGGK